MQIEIAYPDTLVGTDSHTTMVNGLAVLGWGVGGIEAEAAMLGQPYSMVLPEVIGVKLTGKLKEGVTATDLVLTVTQMLRKRGVVGEVRRVLRPRPRQPLDRGPRHHRQHGAGIRRDLRLLPDRRRHARNICATPAAPDDRVALVAAYAKAQGMYRTKTTRGSGLHRRAQARARRRSSPRSPGPSVRRTASPLKDVKHGFATSMDKEFGKGGEIAKRSPVEGRKHDLGHGDVVIAAITSCTNTSNPSVMMGAGLLARKAAAKGLTVKPWVKTSLAPGSQVVAEYLNKSGLQKDLDKLGFNLVGFGCTTCIGNSGPLPPEISKTINDQRFGRTPRCCPAIATSRAGSIADVRANYLASPPLVVAYALAGSMQVDLNRAPLGTRQGRQEGVPQGHLAEQPRDRELRAQEHHQADVHQEIRRRVQGRRASGARSASRAR